VGEWREKGEREEEVGGGGSGRGRKWEGKEVGGTRWKGEEEWEGQGGKEWDREKYFRNHVKFSTSAHMPRS